MLGWSSALSVVGAAALQGIALKKRTLGWTLGVGLWAFSGCLVLLAALQGVPCVLLHKLLPDVAGVTPFPMAARLQMSRRVVFCILGTAEGWWYPEVWQPRRFLAGFLPGLLRAGACAKMATEGDGCESSRCDA